MPSAYITLLTGESYIPGSLVLGQSLKQHGTKHKLAILLDSSSISPDSLELVKQVYDDVIPIEDKLITGSLQQVVEKLGRRELNVTFSKILLWNQTQYDQLVYLDSDTLPLGTLDHLFDEYAHLSGEHVAASPDVGWPDIFNTGVLVLKPDQQVYSKLLAFSSTQNASFDGADQGLLNEFFHLSAKISNWIRLPFVYNVTPSENYQYLPALTRFAKDIKLLHFIGAHKPWHNKPGNSPTASPDFAKLWWDQFNKFYPNQRDRINLLTNQGEAYKLNFAKLSNSWDSDTSTSAAVDASQDLNSLSLQHHPSVDDGTEANKVFPWEHRPEQKPATRVFNSAQTNEPSAPPSVTLPSQQKPAASSAPKPKSTQPSQSSSLKKSYEFDNSQSSSFNPDKSLDEISKLPKKLLSKLKGSPDTSDKK